MREKPDRVGLYDARSVSAPGARYGIGGGIEHLGKIASVNVVPVQPAIPPDHEGDRFACELVPDGDGDRIPVVLHDKNNGEFSPCGPVHSLVEFPFACGALPAGDVHHLVRTVLRRPHRGPQRLEVLGPRRAGLRDDPPLPVPIVERHSETVAARPPPAMQCFKHYLFDRVAELEGKSKIAVIRVRPVMTRTHGKRHRNLRHFVSGTADVKEDLPLSQQDQDLGINKARGKCIRVCTDDLS